MSSPDELTVVLGAAVALIPVARSVRVRLARRQAERDAIEEARMLGWLAELREAGRAQAADPRVIAFVRRHAWLTNPYHRRPAGRHRAIV